MGMRALLLLALALAPTFASAEVNAVIVAPEKAESGDMVILDSRTSKGDNRLWIVDPRLEGKHIVLEDGRVFFAIGRPGAYEFTLVMADTSAQMAYAKHVVQVGVGGEEPQPPTDPDPDPGNTIVRDAVRAATRAVNDPATASAMREALQALSTRTPDTVQAAIATVLLTRSKESQKVDWVTKWREPVNAAIERAGLPYDQAVQQIIDGLGSATQATTSSAGKILLYTAPNCDECQRWKDNEVDKLVASGWTIVEINANSGPVPRMQVCAYDKCYEHVGYMTMSQLTGILETLRP